ncbi:MAG: hypothetical protein LBL60_03470 [Mycoplasmataceae bacterium]|jgi:ribosomal protein S1|nr:hypothetical protein [Mycoplasmataceae bacterium]
MIDFSKVYNCKVVRIEPTYVIADCNGSNGICHISQVSDYRVKNINHFFKLNVYYDFLLTKYDKETNRTTLSYKAIHPKLLKTHREIIPTMSGYETLFKNTLKLLELPF